MGCNSEYMNPNLKEENSKKMASYIVWLNDQDNKQTAEWIVHAANNLYGNPARIDEIAQILCDMCKKTPEETIYNGRDPMARKLADWWDTHQKADKERNSKEALEKKNAAIKKNAIAKLMPHERELLGLNQDGSLMLKNIELDDLLSIEYSKMVVDIEDIKFNINSEEQYGEEVLTEDGSRVFHRIFDIEFKGTITLFFDECSISFRWILGSTEHTDNLDNATLVSIFVDNSSFIYSGLNVTRNNEPLKSVEHPTYGADNLREIERVLLAIPQWKGKILRKANEIFENKLSLSYTLN